MEQKQVYKQTIEMKMNISKKIMSKNKKQLVFLLYNAIVYINTCTYTHMYTYTHYLIIICEYVCKRSIVCDLLLVSFSNQMSGVKMKGEI